MDVMVLSASRVMCLERMMNSFLDKAKYSGEFRFLIHEDSVFENKSEEVQRYIEKSKLFDVVEVDNPWIGQGKSIVKMMPKITSPFFWYLEDDWEFERTLPIDDMLEIMETNKDINQIHLSFRALQKKVPGKIGMDRVERKVGKYTISLEDDWRYMPGIWRYDFLADKYKCLAGREDRPHALLQKALRGDLYNDAKWLKYKGSHPNTELNYELWVRRVKNKNKDLIMKRVGAWVWGHIGDYRYINHTGGHLSMQSWQRGRLALPGGSGDFPDKQHEIDKHPEVPWPEPNPIATGYGRPSR